MRNKFIYRSIAYAEIDKAVLKKGAETKNTLLMLIIGALLVSFAVFQIIGVYNDFHNPEVNRIYIESILITVLPFLIGIYCVYTSIKKKPILRLEYGTKNKILSYADVIEKGKIEELNSILKENLKSRFINDLS